MLHTHDTSGVIHIESAVNEPYTLGQVFTEWGVALSATQLGGLHADATHVLAAYVNGRSFSGDPATLKLKRHLEIALWYGPSGQTPHVPSSYHFPAGLCRAGGRAGWSGRVRPSGCPAAEQRSSGHHGHRDALPAPGRVDGLWCRRPCSAPRMRSMNRTVGVVERATPRRPRQLDQYRFSVC